MPVPIVPCLWFPDCAEEAMEFYCSVFPDSAILSIERYPDESLDEHFAGMSGKVLTGRFVLDGTPFICLDGGPAFTFNEAISLTVECADQAEIDHYWSHLSASPEHEQCGWLKDRFGVSWQIVPANLGELMTGPAQTQALMRMKKIIIDDLVNAG
ncbi:MULTISPECIES: VOC family protein [Brevibacterium]|jgi:predicted 3-demethylubiquinone-9 3-methyltransferase (glyoxalase superfamily)|uniref:3-demethylubiquinone-9 3-methyltransferase (Glyoxalase superfamily) n=1 Tax=Brevibacterium epidermidis TaxID=1698 RepID=A0A9D2ULG6_BREEP|nr:VOC family protein [Brevibacterium epidermidis]